MKRARVKRDALIEIAGKPHSRQAPSQRFQSLADCRLGKYWGCSREVLSVSGLCEGAAYGSGKTSKEPQGNFAVKFLSALHIPNRRPYLGVPSLEVRRSTKRSQVPVAKQYCFRIASRCITFHPFSLPSPFANKNNVFTIFHQHPLGLHRYLLNPLLHDYLHRY